MKQNSASCEFFGWIAFTTNSASMLILTIMAMERFMAIVKPFAYRSWVTKRRVKIAVCVAVGFSASQSALPVVGLGRMKSYNKGAYCHFDYSQDSSTSRIYSTFILFYGFTMTIIVLLAYTVVFIKIRDLIQRHRKMSIAVIARTSGRGGVTRESARRDVNLTVEKMFSYLTVALMLLFWFSWLPFLVSEIFQNLHLGCQLSSGVSMLKLSIRNEEGHTITQVTRHR